MGLLTIRFAYVVQRQLNRVSLPSYVLGRNPGNRLGCDKHLVSNSGIKAIHQDFFHQPCHFQQVKAQEGWIHIA